MTTAVQRLLDSFNALTDAEKHQAIVEIFRGFLGTVEGDLPESALVEMADELFRTLEAEEGGNDYHAGQPAALL